ncbi:putative sarcosine oxidase [Aspergillus steynii IBT 23096]|uniref:Putative sarcosine oxidase n=1 Tax=Aspergillus steynii IBT 23096 TaxID=1392250 RepID=A0A2I2GCL1_9EURO|nr:putative sarcosine oxidase [Aspergillus steynii IBT 23096]PLB50612.1 putative sarcosine oxidase [Aspergillus steynii IBT 23096]
MSPPIVIVGAGAFGLSTALHLSQNVKPDEILVLEQDTQMPPRSSAANDLNKIVRAEYEDPFYTDLTLKAINAWSSGPFAGHFHQTGFLHCVSSEAPAPAIATLNRFHASANSHADIQPHVVPLDKSSLVKPHQMGPYPGSMPGWHGYLNKLDGWAHSAKALVAVYEAARQAGVQFRLNTRVAELIYTPAAAGQKKCTGVRLASGAILPARQVIVTAGAGVSPLLPALNRQITAKAWSVAHIQLTADEAASLRGIPVTYARDLGFFFEPDTDNHLLKLCPMGGGIVNTDLRTGFSTPDFMPYLPREDQAKMRALLRQTLPWCADRPFVRPSLCWFADTEDSDFIVDYVPGSGESVVIVSGDSGHGFKMFPLVGGWVVDLLGGKKVERWAWKENDGKDWKGESSWRLGSSMELRDLKGQESKAKL